MSESKITITVYWPPTEDYINDEQYRYLSEAGINYILGAGEETLHTPENQEKMLRLCEKYNMKMTVHDGDFGPSLLGKDADEIKKSVKKYAGRPAVGGYYLQDEPPNPNIYIKAAKAIKEADKDGVLHLNFFPFFAYPDKKTYERKMRDWCSLCHANGFDVDFLTYDLYPFGYDKGSMNREAFFENLEICRRVGLEYGVKTGIYLQSVSLVGSYPAPEPAALEYEANLALAYGFKWLSYFTWFTPVHRPNAEVFADGIITHDGKKTPLYDTVKQLNSKINRLGEYISDCDSVKVYGNGTLWGRQGIPSDLFVQPCDKLNYTLSVLTGASGSYLMVVNDNFLNKHKIKLKFDKKFKNLSYLSSCGKFKPLKLRSQVAQIELAAGGCCLIALPEGEYGAEQCENESKNLALGATVYATSSLGRDGYYTCLLNDGVRKATDGDSGWRSTGSECCDIILDLKKTKKFNRIDLYRSNALFFPRNFAVMVSNDGKNYDIIGSCSNYLLGNRCACTVEFDTVEARYVKLSIVKQFSSLRQIEIYLDDGSIKAENSYELYGEQSVVEYISGEDIARDKPVYVSSQTSSDYEQWGWSKDNLTNGNSDGGFSSAPKRNQKPESEEFAIVDLGDIFKIDRIDVTARGYYPMNYSIMVSDNGGVWREFVTVEGMKPVGDGMTVEHTSKNTHTARYVMLKGTHLRGDESDGYMLQLGEVEVYGSPVCDDTNLKKALSVYETHGGDIGASIYTEPLTLLKRGELTRSGAERYVKLLLDAVDPEGELNIDGDEVKTPSHNKYVTKKTVGIAAAGAAALAAAAVGAILYRKKKK